MIDLLDPKKQPLVSVLLPTHNRPGYFEIALKSVLAQTYQHVEIIVSDNSDNDDTARLIEPYLQTYDHIYYFRRPRTLPVENWDRCYELSKGDYLNYLMDDDAFHPEKLMRMVSCMVANPSVGLVTSYRELIDAQGNRLPALPGTEKLFEHDVLLRGMEFGRHLLMQGSNVVGEPTTAMFRRKAVPQGFGYLGNNRYKLMTDAATWLSILSKNDCIYLSDPLSYFRIHGGQGQKTLKNVQINASIEWFNFSLDAIEHGWFYHSRAEGLAQLQQKLPAFRKFVMDHYIDHPESIYQLDDVNALFTRLAQVSQQNL